MEMQKTDPIGRHDFVSKITHFTQNKPSYTKFVQTETFKSKIEMSYPAFFGDIKTYNKKSKYNTILQRWRDKIW